MQISLNGRDHEFSGPATLQQVIEQFCKDSKHIIAEHNGQIVKSAQWDATKLKDGDTVELVSIVGGG